MLKRELIKNKVCALFLAALGALSVPLENDATAFIMMLFFAIPLFFSKENQIL